MKNSALMLIALITGALTLTGCDNARRVLSGAGVGGDALASADDSGANRSNLHGLGSVTQPPPVLPMAKGRLAVENVVGPHKPNVSLNLVLPFQSPSYVIQAIGSDGTVYITGADGLAGVRDGKLQWAYRMSQTYLYSFGLADDGGLWFTQSGVGRSYVLNANGEGGYLPSTYRRPLETDRQSSAGCSGNMRYVRAYNISIPLDYECTRPQAELGPDGAIYAGTEAPDLRAYSPTGAPLWKIQTPCALNTLLIGPTGRVFFSCEDNSIHYVENHVLRWSQPGDGEIEEPNLNLPNSSINAVMDREGTVYFVDRAKDGLTTHVHAIAATGKSLWTIQTDNLMAATMRFDGKGRLYISGQRGMSPRLICISD